MKKWDMVGVQEGSENGWWMVRVKEKREYHE